jgi:hypothetical protein
MSDVSELSFSLSDLPEKIRNACDPARPAPARMMAARGLIPLKGTDLVAVLVALTSDPEGPIQQAARKTLTGLPAEILEPACGSNLHAALLDRLAEILQDKEPLLLRIAGNPASSDVTVERLALCGSELISEQIAVNESRLLKAPAIIEALYKNRNTRMSTADRLVDLAVRNNVELKNVPTFRAHAEALQHQLIAEPSAEPLPSDTLFKEALDQDEDDIAVECDEDEGTERVKERFKPLIMRLKDMTVSEKVRFSFIANAAGRAFLVRDPILLVALAAIASPQMTAREAAEIAKSREVNHEILRFIGRRRDWLKTDEVKRALVFNPKTPPGIALGFVKHLKLADLKVLARSKNVPSELRALAGRLSEQRERRGE